MKGVILYKSKYGATKKYVEWLVQETGFDYIDTDNAKISEIQKYDVIILCGGIYAMGVAGLSFLKKNANNLKHKKIAVFCDGASPFDEDAFKEIREKNMTGMMIDVPLFYGRGMWNVEKMNFIDKNLCKMLQKAVAKKNQKEYAPWERALMEAGNNTCDWTDKKYLKPVLEYII